MTKNEIIDSLEYLLSQIEDDDAQIFYTSDEVEAVREAISIVKTLAEEHNNGWIPVSERLPNKDERLKSYCRNVYGSEFIVMIDGATLPTTLYIKVEEDIWFSDAGEYYNVTAWQPLPQPYNRLESD